MSNKFKKRGNQLQQQTKVDFYLTKSILDSLIATVFSENENINLSFYKKIEKFMDLADTSMFARDMGMIVRIETLNNLLDSRINSLVTSHEILLNNCLTGEYDAETVELLEGILSDNRYELSNEDIQELDRYLSEKIHFAFLHHYLPKVENLAMQLKSGAYGKMSDINAVAKDILTHFREDAAMAESNSLGSDSVFIGHADDSSSKDVIGTMMERTKNGVLKTGIKQLNALLNGGFERGRVYLFLAPPKGGKSATLLDMALQIKKYNGDIKPKDPTKKLAVLYITQENTINETLERAWSHYFGVHPDNSYKKRSKEEVIEKFKEVNFLNSDDSGELYFIMVYKGYQEITVNDIEDIVQEELTDKGFECAAVIHDYLKRLRPDPPTGDPRTDYGAMADQLSYLAKRLDVPILEATQFNREGASIVKNQPAKAHEILNSNHIADSFLIVEAVDAVIPINHVESYDDGIINEYMMFKLTEQRFQTPPGVDFTFFHPIDNRMRLKDDIGQPESLSRAMVNVSSTPITVDALGEQSKKVMRPEKSTPRKPSGNNKSDKPHVDALGISPTVNNNNDTEDTEVVEEPVNDSKSVSNLLGGMLDNIDSEDEEETSGLNHLI